MDCKLIALDLDGTVLRSSGTIPSYFSNITEHLHKRGVRVVFCTGRRWRTALPVLQQIKFQHPYIICSGGALIKEVSTCGTVRTLPLPETLTGEGADLFRSCGFVPFFLRDCALLQPDLLISESEFKLAQDLRYVQKNSENIAYFQGDVPDDVEEILEIYSVDKKSKILSAAPVFNEHFEGEARVTALNQPTYGPDYWALELHSLRTTKWHALELLMKQWGIDDQQVVAIGDDVNDIPMLKKAGRSFAMANAVPEAAEAADCMTQSNDQDGVFEALKKIFPDLKTCDTGC